MLAPFIIPPPPNLICSARCSPPKCIRTCSFALHCCKHCPLINRSFLLSMLTWRGWELWCLAQQVWLSKKSRESLVWVASEAGFS